MPPESQAVSELVERYEIADRFTREVTEFRSDVAVPAINELRYAGHHLLHSLDNQGHVAKQDEIRKAKNHCERAMYDAAEAGIIRAVDEIARFHEDHKDLVISRVIGTFSEIRALADTAQRQLVQGRGDRTSAQEQATEYMALFRRLRDAVRLLHASRDDLNAIRNENKAKGRRFIIQIAVLVMVPILVAIIRSMCNN